MLEEANRTLRDKNKVVTPTHRSGAITRLLGKPSSQRQQLRNPTLAPRPPFAFPNHQGRMKGLNEELNTIRLLRNRISHLEPIHHRDLTADHRKIMRVVGYISDEAVKFIRQHERVSHALNRRTAVRRGEELPSF